MFNKGTIEVQRRPYTELIYTRYLYYHGMCGAEEIIQICVHFFRTDAINKIKIYSQSC